MYTMGNYNVDVFQYWVNICQMNFFFTVSIYLAGDFMWFNMRKFEEPCPQTSFSRVINGMYYCANSQDCFTRILFT